MQEGTSLSGVLDNKKIMLVLTWSLLIIINIMNKIICHVSGHKAQTTEHLVMTLSDLETYRI